MSSCCIGATCRCDTLYRGMADCVTLMLVWEGEGNRGGGRANKTRQLNESVFLFMGGCGERGKC